jgi:hypothetical protein
MLNTGNNQPGRLVLNGFISASRSGNYSVSKPSHPLAGHLSLIIALTVTGSAQCQEESIESLSASAILGRVEATYAAARTYQDTGETRTTIVLENGKVSTGTRVSFITAYSIPDRYRFEFTSYHPYNDSYLRWIIFRRGSEIRVWYERERTARDEVSLNAAFANAVAESGGSARDIASLLMPNEIVGLKQKDEGVAAKRLDNAPCDLMECFRVQWSAGEAPHEAASRTIWIETTTFLIRRIDVHLVTGGNKAIFDTTTTYESHLNQPIPGQALEFGIPPGAAAATK